MAVSLRFNDRHLPIMREDELQRGGSINLSVIGRYLRYVYDKLIDYLSSLGDPQSRATSKKFHRI